SFTVVAIKQPEGYQGGGQIFRCDLQVWNSRDKGWQPLWSPKLSAYGSAPEFTNVEIKPNHSEQVCGLLLPLQAGSNGECVRFRMRTPWATGPQQASFISQPFSIGEGPAKQRPHVPTEFQSYSGLDIRALGRVAATRPSATIP